jgi:hypothetical protein
MRTTALIFLLAAWSFVLGLTFWSFYRLVKTDPSNEPTPPPGTSL